MSNIPKININSHYPYSEEYDYETRMEIIDLDKERVEDVTSGNGFIVSAAKAIKDDLKDDNGIFSVRFGNTLQDADPFGNRYRCKCGNYSKRFYMGQVCPVCKTQVKYVDDNFTYFGWIVLKDPYHIIHPNLYMNIASLIGSSTFNEIISPNDVMDEDGKELYVERPKDEPYKRIGMIEFYNRFDEIIDFYIAKRPDKIEHYNLIKEHREKVFTQSIPVYTIHLRPYKLEAGELHFEGTNALYNMMAHYVTKINDDRYKISKKNKPKAQLLYNLQAKYMELNEEINQILSGKKGSIRTLFGKIYCRLIKQFILQNSFNCWNIFEKTISSQDFISKVQRLLCRSKYFEMESSIS